VPFRLVEPPGFSPGEVQADPKEGNDSTAASLYSKLWRAVTDALLGAMEAQQVGHSHLAERLQWPRDRVVSIFCGTYDMTLGEVALMAAALGLNDLQIKLGKGN
jgi:hypothetical protein